MWNKCIPSQLLKRSRFRGSAPTKSVSGCIRMRTPLNLGIILAIIIIIIIMNILSGKLSSDSSMKNASYEPFFNRMYLENIYIYIYIYMFVVGCVCLCLWVCAWINYVKSTYKYMTFCAFNVFLFPVWTTRSEKIVDVCKDVY